MSFQRILSRKLFQASAFALSLAAAGLVLSGCDLTRNHTKMDRSGHMEFQDYRDAMAPREPETAAGGPAADNNIPDLASYVIQPSENLKPMPLVSIAVNQTVPVKDVLYELAQQADYDLELDPRITGSIIFTARNRPFDVVVQRISEIAGLRYRFDDDVLRVELDMPYSESYKVDYLSYIRRSAGSIENSVTVTSSEGGDTGGGTGGSEFSASSESEANFWGELETNLKQILGVAAGSGNMRTGADPQITAIAPNPAPVDPVVVEGEDGTQTVQVQPPNATLQVASLPVDPTASATAAPAAASFSLNKQAGLVSVYGTERQHKEVAKYLQDLRRSVTSQVLIEAKILEVTLQDEFAAGIDWNLLDSITGSEFEFDLTSFGGGVGARPSFDEGITNPVTDFALGYFGNDIEVLVNAISRFGTVKALASPRLTVVNNQAAVLNVANNEVYFELDIEVTTEEGVTQTTVDSEIRNVPEGVLINVQPSIDLDSRSVSMAVRPTITRIDDFRDDPAVAFVAAQNDLEGIVSRIPVVNVQEIDSVVRMDSGQAIVMGGLMRDRASSTINGVPVLSEMPVLGTLFRNQVDSIGKTELVIFLKATILEQPGQSVGDTDRDMYKTFADDRRPLRL